jgi:hypothetical protein
MTDEEFSQDIEPEDVVDTDDPSPEALARFFYSERHRIAPDSLRDVSLDELSDQEKALVIFVFAAIVGKLKREWRPV